MAPKVEKLLKRYNSAKSNSDLWKSTFDEAYSYIFPDRNLFNQRTVGEKKNAQLYDLTPQIAAQRFVSQLHNGLTPLFSQWLELSPGENVPPDMKTNIERGLQQTTDIIFSFLDNSNFNLVINESYHDLVLGTAAFLCFEGISDKDPITFRYVPLQDIHPEQTQAGSIDNVWRTFKKVPVRDINLLWPKATLTVNMKQDLAMDSNVMVDLVEGTVFDEKKKTYTYYVIDLKETKIIFEEKSESSPWIVFRWEKIRGETFGRGPGIVALPTIRSLNKMAQYELESAALRAYPIYLGYDDGVWNPYTASIQPKTIIPIEPTVGGHLPIQPLPEAGDVQFSELKIQDLRDQINKIFFNDPMGPVGDPKMTATEVNLRNQQTLEEKAPSIGRLMVELTSRTIKRVMFILRNRGLLPNIEINNKEVTISYLSPLAALEGLKNVNNLTKMAQTLQAIVGPEVAAGGFKVAKLPSYIGEQLGVEMDIVNSEGEIQQATQLAQQQQQLQQEQPQLPTPPQGGIPQQTGATA